MKMFAILTNLKLTKKPEWLDEFREKYDKPYEFHNTLKQPRFIKEEDVPELKKRLQEFFENLHTPNHKIELIFDEIVAGKDEEGTTIMLRAKNPVELITLQQKLRDFLVEYTNYVKPKYQSYEENFDPHITIARNISETQLKEANEYLKNDFTCEGVVEEIFLHVVNEDTPEESRNPENRTIYKL